MWYVSKLLYSTKRSIVVDLSDTFIFYIRDTETNKCINGSYYDLKDFNPVGCYVDQPNKKLYLGVVNPEGLKFIDFIKDVYLVRNIPKNCVRFVHDIQPINDLYYKESLYFDFNARPLVFITDILYDIFIVNDIDDITFNCIKDLNKFYIDCWSCKSKYCFKLEPKFLSQVSKLKLLCKNKISR